MEMLQTHMKYAKFQQRDIIYIYNYALKYKSEFFNHSCQSTAFESCFLQLISYSEIRNIPKVSCGAKHFLACLKSLFYRENTYNYDLYCEDENHSNCNNDSRDWLSDSDNVNTNPCAFKQYLSNYMKSEPWSQIIYNIKLDLRFLSYSVIKVRDSGAINGYVQKHHFTWKKERLIDMRNFNMMNEYLLYLRMRFDINIRLTRNLIKKESKLIKMKNNIY
jgi:hypothetical protein